MSLAVAVNRMVVVPLSSILMYQNDGEGSTSGSVVAGAADSERLPSEAGSNVPSVATPLYQGRDLPVSFFYFQVVSVRSFILLSSVLSRKSVQLFGMRVLYHLSASNFGEKLGLEG